MLLTTLQKSSIPMDRCSAYAWGRQAWCKWEACSAHKAFDGYLLEAWVLTFANNSCQKQNQEQNGNDSNRVFMLDFYPQFWTKAFDFEGRTKRIDYWKILLVNFILGIILLKFTPSALYYLFAIASICPGLAMNIRRIRDTGRQWQWILLLLIPFLGPLWLIWIECQPSADSE